MANTGGVKLGGTYDQARTRKMNAEAEIAEIELERIHGTMVVAEDVVTAWEDVLGAMKTKLLSLPTKAAPILSTETDTTTCQNILEDMVNEALEELSNYEPKTNTTKQTKSASDGGTSSTKTTKKANSKSVGRPKKTSGLTK